MIDLVEISNMITNRHVRSWSIEICVVKKKKNGFFIRSRAIKMTFAISRWTFVWLFERFEFCPRDWITKTIIHSSRVDRRFISVLSKLDLFAVWLVFGFFFCLSFVLPIIFFWNNQVFWSADAFEPGPRCFYFRLSNIYNKTASCWFFVCARANRTFFIFFIFRVIKTTRKSNTWPELICGLCFLMALNSIQGYLLLLLLSRTCLWYVWVIAKAVVYSVDFFSRL